jgi:signal transduction histidine kinase
MYKNIIKTISSVFIDESIIISQTLDETSSSIFRLLEINEQLYIEDRMQIVYSFSINELLNAYSRANLMIRFDIDDIVIFRNNTEIIKSVKNYNIDYSAVKDGSAFMNKGCLIVVRNYSNYRVFFIFRMSDIASERDTLNFRSFLKKIRDKTSIKYFILQDEKGIIAATGNISKISTIESDTFLKNSLLDDEFHHRFILFNGSQSLEVTKRVEHNIEEIYLMRICYDTKDYFISVRKINIIVFNKEIIINLFNNINSPVIIFNDKFNIILRNYKADNILQGLGENFLKNIIKEISNKKEYKINNRIFDILLSDIIIKEENKRYKLAMFIDQTDQLKIRVLEEELRSNKQIEAFVSEFAHQVKNPLNAISMSIQRIVQKNEIDKNLIKIIDDEIVMLNSKVSNFLLNIRNKRKVSCINDIIADVCKLYSAEIAENNIILTCYLSDNPLYSRIERDELSDAIKNLVKNAIEALSNCIKKEKKLDIKLTEKGKHAEITVTDNGIAIDEKTIGHIFDKYYSNKENGTGIGLYAVKRIIENYGGNVDVKITDSGSKVFIIKLDLIIYS